MSISSLAEYSQKTRDNKPNQAVDVVVVGAGAVGIPVALRLSRGGLRVLLLECGPREPPLDWESRNAGRTVGRPNSGPISYRMKAFGGTTRLWGGQLARFSRYDLDPDPDLGKPGWPVSYDELCEYVNVAYDMLGIDQSGRDTSSLWTKITGRSQIFSPDIDVSMNIWLPQPDFARMFEREIVASPNLTVITDAQVTCLQFAAKGQIKSVQVRSSEGIEQEFFTPQCVLAAGTYEIIRLLLATAATQPESGFADNKHIGRWLVDHLHGECGRLIQPKLTELSHMFDNVYYGKRKYGVKLRASETFLHRNRTGNIAVTFQAPMSIRSMVADLKGLFRRCVLGEVTSIIPTVKRATNLGALLLPIAWRYLVSRRSTTLLGHNLSLGFEVEQLPSPHAFVELDPEFPPRSAPILLHWDLDHRDLRTVDVMVNEVAQHFATAGLGTVEINPLLAAGDIAFFDSCHAAPHPAGGARMADDANYGVVDRNCRVFGTDNLYVAGAAVFASGSFANSTLTAIALGLRTADHIADQCASRTQT